MRGGFVRGCRAGLGDAIHRLIPYNTIFTALIFTELIFPERELRESQAI
jgi:hypothetical protein